MKVRFYCSEEKLPLYYFEAMQIFSHRFGMPEIVTQAEADVLEVAEEDGTVTARYVLDGARARQEALEADALLRDGLVDSNTENLLKRSLYGLLRDVYGYASPWGCMTGVRPAKIVNRMREEGFSEEQVLAHFMGFYQTDREKALLTLETARAQRPFLEEQKRAPETAGFYIGIPFCPTRCTYCSFAASPIGRYKKSVDAYLGALEAEIAGTLRMTEGIFQYESLYIGGGTPTSLNAEQLGRLLRMTEPILRNFRIREFALEAGRPDSITEEKLLLAKSAGVNRISVNPQTMNAKTLERIGRKHSPEDTLRAFALAREVGFCNINMDIIAGLPGETTEDFLYTLSVIRTLRPDSLTVHTLSIKRASELRYDEAEKTALRAEVTGAMTEAAGRAAAEMGLRPFYMYRQKNMLGNHENVCYCRAGCESPYNIHIMEEDQSIVACGCGAVSKFVYDSETEGCVIDRCFNMKSIETYLERPEIMAERKREALRRMTESR